MQTAGSLYENAKDLRRTSTPTIYFGRLEYPMGSSWNLKRQTSTGTAEWPIKGWLLQAEKDIALVGSTDIIISGGIFFPQRSRGTWFESSSSRAYSFEIPAYDWWFLDGTVKAPISGSVDFLFGFRWNHTDTKVDYGDNSRDGYILDSYIPLIGAQFNQRFSASALVFRVVGSPLPWGRMTYHFWEPGRLVEYGEFPFSAKSSFLEFFADYRINCTRDVVLVGFAKWNRQSVQTHEQSLSGDTSEPVSWDVDIRSWTLGADVSVVF